MPKMPIPDLTFPEAKFTAMQTPWDLQYMLYRNGGDFSAPAFARIDKTKLTPFLPERLPLVVKIHQVLRTRLIAGVSQTTIKHDLVCLRYFYRWANRAGRSPTLTTARTDFLDWSEFLLQQSVTGKLGRRAAYKYPSTVGDVLDSVLNSQVKLLSQTRIVFRDSVRKKRALHSKADKQNLSDTFAFGHMLCDLTDALSVDAIRGNLPLKIEFRTGQVLEEWSGLRPQGSVKALSGMDDRSRARSIQKREAWIADASLRTRHPLANLRIEAELLIFIASTGMNLSQARELKSGDFIYASYLDGYQVRRIYKDRRKGEVEFQIYREYREFFERYLVWRKTLFPDDDRLFPRCRSNGASESSQIAFKPIERRCKKLGIHFLGPQILRKTRTNWLLRRTKDPDITAEMAQHARETLICTYETPNHQLAAIEISRFHLISDPALPSPGPGVCAGNQPELLVDAPPDAPRPDCGSPAGCLFCRQQRDVDSEDHAWSLASYRHLKSLELAKYRLPGKKHGLHPARLVIDRVSAKLDALRAISPQWARWVDEALARIAEGVFHPAWEGFIRLSEVGR